jgi:hypothetical protein
MLFDNDVKSANYQNDNLKTGLINMPQNDNLKTGLINMPSGWVSFEEWVRLRSRLQKSGRPEDRLAPLLSQVGVRFTE